MVYEEEEARERQIIWAVAPLVRGKSPRRGPSVEDLCIIGTQGT